MTMQAGILAAGVGSRLDPLTRTRPKCMVRVDGRPILQHQLDALRVAGVSEVFIVVGYLGSVIADWCRKYRGLEVTCIENPQYEFTNNMFSSSLLREHLDGQPFLLCNGDVVYDAEIIRSLVEESDGDWVAVDVGQYIDEAMKIAVDPAGAVRDISKILANEDALGSSIDLYRFSATGATVFFEEAQKIIDENRPNQWTEVALQRCFASRTITAHPFPIGDLRWAEIDNLEDLALADRIFSGFDIQGYEQIFLDLDGTLVVDSAPIEGAVEFVRSLRDLGVRVHVISNNSSNSRSGFAARLGSIGFDIAEEDIVISTDGLIAAITDLGIERVFCLGTRAMMETLEAAGLSHDGNHPEAVVVGYDTELTYNKLRAAATHINRGIPYFATHPDISYPSQDGPIPDIGALLVMLEATTGVAPQQVFGKPNLAMIDSVLGSPRKALMIGDRLYTDGALAVAAGIDFACVLSGETTREDLQQLPADQWPTAVARTVVDLLGDTPAV